MEIYPASVGDYADISLQARAGQEESMGVYGHYHVVCHDSNGVFLWEENFPNAVVAVGKQILMDTLLRGSAYSVTGPFLGLTSGTTTPAYNDTMASHAGWSEFVNYTTSGAVRGTAVFAASSSNTTASPNNVTTSAATAIVYTITGAGGTVGGCFLVLGTGAVNTQSSTAGTLYSAGAFASSKTVTAGDTVSVTYSTTATG